MGAMSLSGLQVSRKVFVPSSTIVSNQGFARYLEILTNPTGAPITVLVRVGTVHASSGNLGSDSSTVITGNSAGGTTLTNGLNWFTSDDATDGGGDPSLGHVLWGTGASVQVGRVVQSPSWATSVDSVIWEYTVTVPANSTRILMHFETQQANRTNSKTAAAAYMATPSYTLYGMSVQEQAAVVNFRLVTSLAEANGPYSGAEGSAIAVSAAGSTPAPGASITNYQWDCASDGTFEISTTSTASSCTYTRYGSYTATLRITDSLGFQVTDTAAVTVTNVAPTITNVAVSGDTSETGSVGFAATVTHAGTGDTLTYSWSFGDGQTATGASVSRTFPDNGTYTWSVTVRDTGNLSDTRSGTVTITNRAPTISNMSLPSGLTEGTSGSVSASASDPAGSSDPLTYTWSWGDGSSDTTVSQASTSHTLPNNGTFTVTLTVSDGDGGTATASGTLTIGNVNPTITAYTPTTSGLEGGTYTYSATATDPGTDPLTYTWNFGDSSTATGNAVSQVYAQEGSYTVTLTVSDGDGGTATRTSTVIVANATPSISSSSIPGTGGEGEILTFTVAATDPGNDPLSVSWNFGDGQTGTGTTATHAYADQGTFTVLVTVSDNAGASVNRSASVEISNLNPTISTLDGTFSGSQGEFLSFSALATDPGLDTLTYRWDFGDGTSVSGVNRTTASHTYTRIDSYTLTLTVTDEDGGSATSSRTVSIGNSGPSIADVSGSSTGDEGELLTFQVLASDPGDDPLTYRWDFGDGTAPEEGATLSEVDHVYYDNGTYTITVTVADPSAATASATLSVVVANVAPTITPIPASQTVNQGAVTSFRSGATDPGDDLITLTWDFGDGTATVVGNDTSHTWYEPGVYTVTLTAVDDDGGRSTASFAVTVSNLPPELSSVVGPSSLSEGDPATWSIIATDASQQPVSLLWEFGDGASATGTSVSHTYEDDGSYTLRVTGTDLNGATDVEELVVVVSNLDPVVTQVVIPSTGNQGDVLSFSVTATDVAADPLSYRWSFGGGAEANTAQASFSWAHPGTYPVSVTITDDTTGQTTHSSAVVIVNLDPVVESFQADSSGEEASPCSASFLASDASGDEPSASLDWGDGTVEPVLEDTLLTHTYADDGTYVAVLSVSDEDGATVLSRKTIQIANVSPSIQNLQGTPYGKEGDDFSYAAGASDPAGDRDTLTFTWDFGDGTTPVSGVNLTSTSHRYTLSGQYTLTLVVSDEDGGSSSRTLSVNVATAAPYIRKAEAIAEGNEGDSFTFAVDGTDPTDQPLTYTFDFGDGTRVTQATGDAEHVYEDDGLYTAVITVSDPDALTAQATFTIDVADVPPSFLSTPTLKATEATLWRYSVEVEAAPTDILQLTLVSGPEGASLDASGLLTWTPTLAQAQAGQATFSLRASDEDGSEAVDTFVVSVSILDVDQDGVSDTVEVASGMDPTNPNDASQDADGDGRSNLEEYQAGTSISTSDRPNMPTILSPEDGTEVTAQKPTFALQFSLPTVPSSAPIPSGLQVELELYKDPGMTNLVERLTTAALDKVTASGSSSDNLLTLQATLSPTQALPDNSDVYARARATDPYASGDWSEPSVYFINTSNDAPGLPSLSYPQNAESVASTALTFLVDNADDADRDALTLEIELADAAAPETLLDHVVGLEQDPSGSTAWTPGAVLVTRHTYLWRARATDDQGALGEWTEVSSFTVLLENHAPSTTEILSPAEGEEVTDNPPVVQILASEDIDGDDVGYLLQLSTSSNFRDIIEVSADLAPAGDAIIDLEVTEVLTENTLWYARAQAMDVDTASEWSPTVSFFVNSENDAPGAPTLQNPANNSNLTSPEVTFTVNNASDPDRDSLTYTVVALGPEGAELRIEQVEEDPSGMTTLTGTLPAAGTWTWTAFATDEEGLAGPESAPNTLVIEADAPVSPTPDVSESPVPEGTTGCSCSQPEASPLPSAGMLLTGLLGLLGLSLRRRRQTAR